MSNTRKYNIFIFLSTFIRNILEVYSIVYLYKKGFNYRSILSFYILLYILGIFISSITIYLSSIIKTKYILIFSILMSIISYYLLYKINNYYLLVPLLSLSMFTYHPIRHLYGIKNLNNRIDIGNNLIFMYLALLLSNIIVIKKINILYVILLSILSIIPLFFIDDKKEKFKLIEIKKDKIIYFILDQGRVLFLLFEPLYLYIYISSKISYIGLFNIILTIASIIYIYLIGKYLNLIRNFKYINIIFVIILLLKLNINNKHILLIIAFLEGLLSKTSELYSTRVMYQNKTNIYGYIFLSEIVFLLTRIIILIIMYFINNLIVMLYVLILIIFSISIKKNTSYLVS